MNKAPRVKEDSRVLCQRKLSASMAMPVHGDTVVVIDAEMFEDSGVTLDLCVLV